MNSKFCVTRYERVPFPSPNGIAGIAFGLPYLLSLGVDAVNP
jgi:hypothetical protein